MKKISLILLLSIFFVFSSFASTIKVESLRTEYMRNPIGIDAKNPSFSWELSSDERAVSQLTYEIILSTDRAGKTVVWNSGKIKSDKSVNIKYTGNELSASTRYYWHVDVSTNKGKASSQTAFFETGLMNTDWSNANWIKLPPFTDSANKDAKAAHFTLEMDVKVIKDNAGVIFSAHDLRNMYMWAINTYDYDQPVLRRHVYSKGNPVYTNVMLGKYFSKTDLIGKKVHFKIEAENNAIKTYINNTLVDTYKDESGKLIDGFIGFRAFKGGDTDEQADYSNIVYTNYDKSPVETFTANKEIHFLSKDDGDHRILLNDPNNEAAKYDEDSNDNGTPMFRKTFDVTKQIASAKIYSSALGTYDLFMNGQRVGRLNDDGTTTYDELKPAWTDYQKTVQYLTYDVTNLLKSGKNAIGAEVTSGWWTGNISHGEYGTPALAFIAKLIINYTDGTSQTIVSDPSWQSSNDGAVRMGSIYNGETYDARKESNWANADYNNSNWKNAIVDNTFKGNIVPFEGATIRVRPQLTQHPISTTVYDGIKKNGTDRGLINILTVADGFKSVELKKGQTVLFDMGQNMVGWVKFTVAGEQGTTMKVRFGEMLNSTGVKSRGDDGAAGSLYTANLRSAKATLRYTLNGNGDETFSPSFTYFGFRYCEVTATEDITLKKLDGIVVGSATEELGSFETSSPIVNKLYSNILWGQRGNYFGVPTDCPQRDERLGWTGDTQVFSRAASYNADVAGFFHKWMGDMSDSQRADGAYPDVAPHSWVGYGSSAWADAGIIVPWNIYVAYDDPNILKIGYPSMEKYMNFLSKNGDKDYKYNGAYATYGDWLTYENTDSRYISVCYYAYVADLMSKISAALSEKSEDMYAQNATKYATLYKNIKAEFQTRYVNADGSLKQKSQTAYLLALKLNLFPNADATTTAVKYLVTKIAGNNNTLSTGFLGTGILNQTLSEYDADGTAYSLLLQRNCPSWLYSVDQGATTIWERWNSYTIATGFGDVGMNSFNHYSYGAVAEWMYRYVLGIGVDENNPGFKHIILQPRPDTRATLPDGQERITWAKGSYHSYYGLIKSAWTLKDDGLITYNVTVPANTTATLYLPLIKKDGVVYEGGKLAPKSNGITFVGIKDGKVIYQLKSGDYNFDVRAK